MTQKYKKRMRVCFLISMVLWLGLCGFLVVYGMWNSVTPESETVANKLADIFVPLTMSYIVALLLFIFVREKLRNTVWIVNVVLSAALLGETFLYISIALFSLDEFIILPLYKMYKNKYNINREIDKREQVR